MEFLKICSICVLLLLGGEKSCRGFHFYLTFASDFATCITIDPSQHATTEKDYTATENPVANTIITSSTTEKDYTATENPVANTIITSSTTENAYTSTENPVANTIITSSTTEKDYTATENPVANTIITSSTTEKDYTATENPVANTIITSSTTENAYTSTENPVANTIITSSTTEKDYTATENPVANTIITSSTTEKDYTATENPVANTIITSSTTEKDYTATENPVANTIITSSTTEKDYTATENPVANTIITSSTTEKDYTATENPVANTIITSSTTEKDYTSTENPVANTIITSSTTEKEYTATENPVDAIKTKLADFNTPTTSSDRTVTEETKEDTEFVLFENITASYEDCYKLCRNISNNATKFHPLFFYDLTEDLNDVVMFISTRSIRYRSYRIIEVWTDYQELNPTLLISNHTGHVINISQEASNKLCVILEVEGRDIKRKLKEKPCNNRYRVVCRAHNASAYVPSTGNNSSKGSGRDCGPVPIPNTTPTAEQLDKILENIRKNLTVVKANLSSNIRKRKSASDPRTSSRIIGMTLGVTIICLSASLLIIPDMLAVLNFVVSKCIRQCTTT